MATQPEVPPSRSAASEDEGDLAVFKHVTLLAIVEEVGPDGRLDGKEE